MIQWYAYKHANGTLHLKRYFGDPMDVREAKLSPFVQEVTGPFEAKNRATAKEVMEARFSK